MTQVQIQNEDAAACRWNDALVAAPTSDDMWAVTSPNMEFVPTPLIGVIEVVLRDDSPIWWSPREVDFELLEGSVIKCLGLLRRCSLQPLSDLVDDLTGRVRALPGDRDPRLSYLESAMRHARDRLLCFPCTWRDVRLQVRLTQRFWLMAQAVMDFQTVDAPSATMRPVDRRFMGAFTSDPEAVQRLWSTGIPVWWLRLDLSILTDTKVRAIVPLTATNDICVSLAPGYGDVLYRGIAGPKHLRTLSRGGHMYQDVSRNVLLAVETDRGYAAPPSQKEFKSGRVDQMTSAGPSRGCGNGGQTASRQQLGRAHPYGRPHATQVRGVNKFEPLRHEWMPPPLGIWERVMAGVDLAKPARPQSEIWGYWIPEPGLLLRPQSADRRKRYIYNWLRIRAAWLYVLRLREARATLLPTQWWRDFLYGDTGRTDRRHDTRNAQRQDSMTQAFQLAFQQADYDLTSTAPVTWFKTRLPTLDERLCPLIIWEVCELGFRHELLALDRLLVPGRDGNFDEEQREELLGRIFVDHSPFCVADLPTERAGLSGPTPFHRVPYLESFRRVMARWPRAPASLYQRGAITTSLSPAEITSREEELVEFYVNTFFEQSGRAPIIPHAVPI
ncbi:hypothetical protein LXA43DRAFT_894450 [Ganoderma leucocontextum]|nr:hypothetical protein LXA43DRAFT_894450 [Ganoderma leucocontextum]